MSLVITGARAVVKLGGEVVLFAAGVNVTQEERLEEIPQLDNLEVAEYAENGHRCSISISTVKLAPGASSGGQNVFNAAAYFNLESNKDTKLKLLQPEFIIEIVDEVPQYNGGRLTGFEERAIYIGYGAKFEGGTGSLDARGVWQGNWSFKCRRGTGI